jgi:hypothetical protein
MITKRKKQPKLIKEDTGYKQQYIHYMLKDITGQSIQIYWSGQVPDLVYDYIIFI